MKKEDITIKGDLELNLISTDLVTVEEIEFIQELWKYKFSNRIYEIYKHITNNNMNTTYAEAKKKLIRNILCSKEAPYKEGLEYKRVFYYGNLQVHINLNEKRICYIKCHKYKSFKVNINRNKKNILNEIIRIYNNIN